MSPTRGDHGRRRNARSASPKHGGTEKTIADVDAHIAEGLSDPAERAAWQRWMAAHSSIKSNAAAEAAGALVFKSARQQQGGAFLSNFYPLSTSAAANEACKRAFKLDPADFKPFPVPGLHEDASPSLEFATSEHAYAYAKACCVDAGYALAAVARAPTALAAKKAAGSKAYVAYLHASHPKGDTLHFSKVQALGCYTRAVAQFDAHATMMKVAVHPLPSTPLLPHTHPTSFRYSLRAQVLWAKFTHNRALGDALLSTGDQFLAEQQQRGASVWDVGGANRLGFEHMLTRMRLAAARRAPAHSAAGMSTVQSVEHVVSIDRSCQRSCKRSRSRSPASHPWDVTLPGSDARYRGRDAARAECDALAFARALLQSCASDAHPRGAFDVALEKIDAHAAVSANALRRHDACAAARFAPVALWTGLVWGRPEQVALDAIVARHPDLVWQSASARFPTVPTAPATSSGAEKTWSATLVERAADGRLRLAAGTELGPWQHGTAGLPLATDLDCTVLADELRAYAAKKWTVDDGYSFVDAQGRLSVAGLSREQLVDRGGRVAFEACVSILRRRIP